MALDGAQTRRSGLRDAYPDKHSVTYIQVQYRRYLQNCRRIGAPIPKLGTQCSVWRRKRVRTGQARRITEPGASIALVLPVRRTAIPPHTEKTIG